MANDDSVAIGIDLGTTFSRVAVFRNGKVEIIPNEQGYSITPSQVAFNDVERLIGDTAKNQVALNTKNSIFDVKRLIGRKFDDPIVQNDMKQWPFKVIEVDSRPKLEVTFKNETKKFAPEEISSMVLGKMKQIAEDYLNQKVTNAVITVPANFNDSQRQSTKDAGTIAGLNVLRIINEPTAAAIAYALNADKSERNILVYDLGGGTFDVSVLTVADQNVEVKATAGDTHLGGEDFDNLLMQVMAEEFKQKSTVNIQDNEIALRRLRTACETAKRTLSSDIQATIEIDALCEGIYFSTTISREKFEEINAELFRSTIEMVEKALADANMTKKDIHDVVLVGGSSRIAKIQNLIKEIFERSELCETINPNEAVVCCAAKQAAILHRETNEEVARFCVKDVTQKSLGIEVRNNSNPDAGELISVVIKRNTQIPVSQTLQYFTCSDNQTELPLKILQGEHQLSKHNHELGKCTITGIPRAPAGHEPVDVTFSINDDGLLHVMAVLKSNEQVTCSLTISFGRLTQDEIQRMTEEAKILRKQDEKLKKCVSMRKDLEKLCHDIKSSFCSKSDGGVVNVLNKCNEVIQWLEGGVRETKERYFERYKEVVCVVLANKYTLEATIDETEEGSGDFGPEIVGREELLRNDLCIQM